MHHINSIEAAFKETGRDIAVLKVFESLPEQDRKPMASHYRIVVMVEAICKVKNWAANYNDLTQRKYCAWPDVIADEENPSGSGLSDDVYGDAYAYSVAGSRLSLPSSEDVKYVFELLKEDYEEYMLFLKRK